jgi:Mn-containing catalase
MLQDIAVEEMGHLEMVGQMIEAHTRGLEPAPGTDSSLFAVRGKGPHFLDSNGVFCSTNYINEGGEQQDSNHERQVDYGLQRPS